MSGAPPGYALPPALSAGSGGRRVSSDDGARSDATPPRSPGSDASDGPLQLQLHAIAATAVHEDDDEGDGEGDSESAASPLTPQRSSQTYLARHSATDERATGEGIARRVAAVAARAARLHAAERAHIRCFTPKYLARGGKAGDSAADDVSMRWRKGPSGTWRAAPLQPQPQEPGPRLILDELAGVRIDGDDDDRGSAQRKQERRQRSPGRRLPTPAELAAQRRVSTPIAGGVQMAWDSGKVQMGPFRRLFVFEPRAVSEARQRLATDGPSAVSGGSGGNACTGCGGGSRPISRERARPPSSLTASRAYLAVGEGGAASPSPPLRRPFGASSPGGGSDGDGGLGASGTRCRHHREVSPPMRFALPDMASMVGSPPPPPVRMASSLPPRYRPCKCRRGCASCEAVTDDIERFECAVAQRAAEEAAAEEAVARRRRQHRRQLQVGVTTGDEEAAGAIGGDGDGTTTGGGGAVAAAPSKGTSLSAKITAVRAIDKLKLSASKTRHRHRFFAADDSGPTIAQLYTGMTHRDREDLYISIVGGLSFDLTREKFDYMVQRVLAPRIRCVVTEEHVHSMFNVFDINQGGTISYFEYLSALSHALITSAQSEFLAALFEMLHDAPFAPPPPLPGGAVPGSPTRRRRSTALSPLSPLSPLATRKSTSPASGTTATATTTATAISSLSPPPPSSPGGSGARRATLLLEPQHLTQERLRRCIFALRNHSLMFPHPREDALAAAVAECFTDLEPDDRVPLQKFMMFIFCDDDVMDALAAVLSPSSSAQLSRPPSSTA